MWDKICKLVYILGNSIELISQIGVLYCLMPWAGDRFRPTILRFPQAISGFSKCSWGKLDLSSPCENKFIVENMLLQIQIVLLTFLVCGSYRVPRCQYGCHAATQLGRYCLHVTTSHHIVFNGIRHPQAAAAETWFHPIPHHRWTQGGRYCMQSCFSWWLQRNPASWVSLIFHVWWCWGYTSIWNWILQGPESLSMSVANFRLIYILSKMVPVMQAPE